MSSEELELQEIEQLRLEKLTKVKVHQKYFEKMVSKKRGEEIADARDEYLKLI